MSILTNNNKDYQEKENKTNHEDDDDYDETSKFVSIKIENTREEQPQTSVPTLRSILCKRTEKKMSTDQCNNVQQTSVIMDHNVNNDGERDSDYTEDENEEQINGNCKNIEEKNKNNEQNQPYHQNSHNDSHHQQEDQFFRTLPSTSVDFPLETETGTEIVFNGNIQSSIPTACVTFTKDQPTIISRSSSTPQFTGLDIQPRSSITYINLTEDMSTSIPITTTTSSGATLGSEFRPVYVSPLKYRPLVGLSASDSRLLLEKRVSLLGKPLVFHPIQKRSPSYRRTQLRIYNFLERPHGCKAVFYHTFV
jgi:hypothetical protein